MFRFKPKKKPIFNVFHSKFGFKSSEFCCKGKKFNPNKPNFYFQRLQNHIDISTFLLFKCLIVSGLIIFKKILFSIPFKGLK